MRRLVIAAILVFACGGCDYVQPPMPQNPPDMHWIRHNYGEEFELVCNYTGEVLGTIERFNGPEWREEPRLKVGTYYETETLAANKLIEQTKADCKP